MDCFCDEAIVSCTGISPLNNYHELRYIYDHDTQSYSSAEECLCDTFPCDFLNGVTSCWGYTPGSPSLAESCINPKDECTICTEASCSVCPSSDALVGYVALETAFFGCTQTLMLVDETIMEAAISDIGSDPVGTGGTEQNSNGGERPGRYFYLAAAAVAALTVFFD